ncbi:hypothetical protein [Arthrobacter ulcerisalmonis]|uniref:hypothetical protein n=1 Tax=Arthrobacter ulcerisalmonis TaxID=2483813 RepID=UPI003625A83B
MSEDIVEVSGDTAAFLLKNEIHFGSVQLHLGRPALPSKQGAFFKIPDQIAGQPTGQHDDKQE